MSKTRHTDHILDVLRHGDPEGKASMGVRDIIKATGLKKERALFYLNILIDQRRVRKWGHRSGPRYQAVNGPPARDHSADGISTTEEFLAKHGATKCPTGHAAGAYGMLASWTAAPSGKRGKGAD